MFLASFAGEGVSPPTPLAPESKREVRGFFLLRLHKLPSFLLAASNGEESVTIKERFFSNKNPVFGCVYVCYEARRNERTRYRYDGRIILGLDGFEVSPGAL